MRSADFSERGTGSAELGMRNAERGTEKIGCLDSCVASQLVCDVAVLCDESSSECETKEACSRKGLSGGMR